MAGKWVKTPFGGARVQAQIARANGRAVVAIGEQVVVETKRVTHVDKGTLRRSVHAAPVGYDGSGDEGMAATVDLSETVDPGPTMKPGGGAAVEVGSWLPYACAEWVGRGHPGVTQGLEIARGMCNAIVLAAYKAEGL